MLDFRHFRQIAALAAALALAGPAAAQSPGNVPREKSLIIAVSAEAPVYRNVGLANPYSVNSLDLRGSIINAFEPLFYFNNAADEAIPWLATGYEYADDFSSVTVKLRDGVTWSDGQPFSAEDVAFTLDLLKANGEEEKSLLMAADIAGAVAHAEAIDPLTVRIDFTSPNPRFVTSFLMNHISRGIYILPAHIWREVEDPASFTFFDLEKGWPVTTGPWTVTRFTENQVFMDRRDEWWAVEAGLATMPQMERVITIPGGGIERMVQLIAANQVDTIMGVPVVGVIKQLVASNPKIETFTGDEPPFGTLDAWPTSLYFNHKSGKWADLNVRRAINYYIDRTQVIDVAFSGASEPKYDPFPGYPSLQPYIDAIRPIADKYGIGTFDRAKGDELMRAAGYEKNAAGIWEKDGEPLTAIIETLPALNATVPIIAQQLKNAGIDASFRSTPESRAIMRDGKYDLALFGHLGSTIDPYETLDVYHSKNAFEVGRPTLNLARWSNAEYDAYVEELAQMSPDDPRVVDTVKGAMEIWMQEAVEVPINEWYHRIPMNQTYWVGWPSEENPYMLPAAFYPSGTFGYIMPRLRPAQ